MPHYNPKSFTNDGYVLHLMIIWHNALKHRNYIINDLNDNFEIVRIFKCQWDNSFYLENFMTFYAHSQYQRNRNDYIKILNNKIDVCGRGDFLLVVFKDYHPFFECRSTSNGCRIVNRRVFDKKTEYRLITGGGHRIHGSDDSWETNKDLTILLGMNSDDFLNKYESRDKTKDIKNEIIELSKNCLGVGGYNSINELFYVLNNTIDYVVLRNHEVIPDEYTVEGHGDIDLLVENKNYAIYLTLAKPVYFEGYRVYHHIKISGKDVPFDFRFLGDNYYVEDWERNILNNRIFVKNLFYRPSNINQYYSLLYHAYIQKPLVKRDYIPKLSFYAQECEIEYNQDVGKVIQQLDIFLASNNYDYVCPNDFSVYFNKYNLKLSRLYTKRGILIKTLEQDNDNGLCYISKVYEKEGSFVKIGTPWLIDNEYTFLKKLEKYDSFPKVLSYNKGVKESVLEISRIEGKPIEEFFKWRNHLHSTYMKSFVQEVCNIIDTLRKEHIIHRDFIPQNLLISEKDSGVRVNLIDFGWAINDEEIDTCRKPFFLAGLYRPKDNKYSDSYTFGKSLLDIHKDKWHDMPYTQKCAARLISGSTDISDIKVTIKDEYRLFLYRHKKVFKIHKYVFRQLRKVYRKLKSIK